MSIASLGRAESEGLVAIAVGAAVGVLLLAFAEYRLVGLTSALALSVLGTFHGMFFILAGVVFFGDTLTWRHFAGGCVILIGTLLFAFSRHSKAAKVFWVANKRFEISKFKFKFPRARTYEMIGLVLGCIEAKFCK